LGFGALFIKQRLGLTDEETVEQIRENGYMQFFLCFACFSSKALFEAIDDDSFPQAILAG